VKKSHKHVSFSTNLIVKAEIEISNSRFETQKVSRDLVWAVDDLILH